MPECLAVVIRLDGFDGTSKDVVFGIFVRMIDPHRYTSCGCWRTAKCPIRRTRQCGMIDSAAVLVSPR